MDLYSIILLLFFLINYLHTLNCFACHLQKWMCQPANCFGKFSPHGDQSFLMWFIKMIFMGKMIQVIKFRDLFLKSPYLENRLPRYHKIFLIRKNLTYKKNWLISIGMITNQDHYTQALEPPLDVNLMTSIWSKISPLMMCYINDYLSRYIKLADLCIQWWPITKCGWWPILYELVFREIKLEETSWLLILIFLLRCLHRYGCIHFHLQMPSTSDKVGKWGTCRGSIT